MPLLYVTGLDDEGRSCLADQQEVSRERGSFTPYFTREAPEIPSSPSDVPLLRNPTRVGGIVHHFHVYQPGEWTERHRTTTVDLDIVVSGSIECELEAATLTLNAGDSILINGHVHAWRPGSEGAVVIHTMVPGRTGSQDAEVVRARIDAVNRSQSEAD